MLDRWVCTATLTAVGALLGIGLWAQNITGSIVGEVTDPSGSAIPGVEITVRNAGTGAVARTTTDATGTYTVPSLLASTYEVTARKEGFQTSAVSGIQLLSSQTLRQDMRLQVGGVQQTVEVAGQALLIHTDTQTIGSSLGIRQVADLPLVSHSIDSLIALAPGVVTSGGNPRISGSSYWGGSNFTLNGVSLNDAASGSSAYSSGVTNFAEANMPAPDSLQEFKIDSGDQNAEYRNVASVSMVTKQGTNSFHGLAYEYLQNNDLNANTFLLNATGQPRAPSHLNQFGADLGGPIVKNKVFVYGAYRGIRDRYSNTAEPRDPFDGDAER